MERAAVYVRVSTDTDAQKDSPANQIATCREYAQSAGLETSDSLIYNDTGISGAEMANRPEVGRLLEDARAGRFEAVLFTAISRFSRDLSDAFGTKKRLENVYGIRLISIEEGYDSAVEGRNSEMVFTVHAMLAAHKSQEMSIAIRRGLRQSARRGRHIGNIAPFGYRKGADKKLVPDPRTAPTVRDIFAMYLAGMGSKAIAEALNARGVPTASALRLRRDTLWQASTVTAILHNEVYVGTIVAHKRTRKQDLAHSRRADRPIKRLQLRDSSEWVVIPGAHEPIVGQDAFDRAQRLLAQKARCRGMKRRANLLAGLMVCASCGGKMIVTGGGRRHAERAHQYAVCSKVRRIGKSACDNHSATRYGELLDAVLALLRAPAAPVGGRGEFPGASVLPGAGEADAAQLRVDCLRKELEKNEEEQRRNLAAYRTGLFPGHIIEKSQRELASRAKTLRSELDRLKRQEEDRAARAAGQAAADAALNPFQHMHLYDEMSGRLALQSALDRIVIGRDGDIEVYLAWSHARDGRN